MMELEAEQKQIATLLIARHIQNPVLKSAVIEVAERPNVLGRELAMLGNLTDIFNTLCDENLDGKGDPTLKEIAGIAEVSFDATASFPHPFSWRDRDQRAERSKTFLQTAQIMNSEIAVGYHRDPSKIRDGNAEDIFRFYMLDFYARWWTTNTFPNRDLSEDREFSGHLSNAMCEAAIVGAERGNEQLSELTSWLLGMGWISETAGFDKSLVQRAEEAAKAKQV